MLVNLRISSTRSPVKLILFLSLNNQQSHMINILLVSFAWSVRQAVHPRIFGPVHTMPDKFENATLLLRIRLPSTLIRLYPHKRSTKTELFENVFQSGTIRKRYFFALVWTENLLYPQLFEYADVILSCNFSSQVLQHGE